MGTSNIAKLDQAIKAVCPIAGVSIGRSYDKATWEIQFEPEASAQERSAAYDVLEAFVWDESQPALKTTAEKLAAIGLTVAELKSELAK